MNKGIYPPWATLIQTISQSQGQKKKHFAAMQDAVRKDVERAFGVLQARFAIIKGPARFWKKDNLHTIITTCVLLHNMIVEDVHDQPSFDDILSLFLYIPLAHPTLRLILFFKDTVKFNHKQAIFSCVTILLSTYGIRKGKKYKEREDKEKKIGNKENVMYLS